MVELRRQMQYQLLLLLGAGQTISAVIEQTLYTKDTVVVVDDSQQNLDSNEGHQLIHCAHDTLSTGAT